MIDRAFSFSTLNVICYLHPPRIMMINWLLMLLRIPYTMQLTSLLLHLRFFLSLAFDSLIITCFSVTCFSICCFESNGSQWILLGTTEILGCVDLCLSTNFQSFLTLFLLHPYFSFSFWRHTYEYVGKINGVPYAP